MKMIVNHHALLHIGVEIGLGFQSEFVPKGVSLTLDGVSISGSYLMYHFTHALPDDPKVYANSILLAGITGDTGTALGGYDVTINNRTMRMFNRYPSVLEHAFGEINVNLSKKEFNHINTEISIPHTCSAVVGKDYFKTHSSVALYTALFRELNQFITDPYAARQIVYCDSVYSCNKPRQRDREIDGLKPTAEILSSKHFGGKDVIPLDDTSYCRKIFSLEEGLLNLAHCAERTIGSGSCSVELDPNYHGEKPIGDGELLPLIFTIHKDGSGVLAKFKVYLPHYKPETAAVRRGFIITLIDQKALDVLSFWIHSQYFPSQEALLTFIEALLKERNKSSIN